MLGLPLSGSHMANQIGKVLGAISEDEHALGRPMLSAMAVRVTGIPGDGFYTMARDLGRLTSDDKTEQRRFWEEQSQAVYETWARPLHEPSAGERTRE